MTLIEPQLFVTAKPGERSRTCQDVGWFHPDVGPGGVAGFAVADGATGSLVDSGYRTGGLRGSPVVFDKCVGCGVCEMMCPVDPPAIEVVERLRWEDV